MICRFEKTPKIFNWDARAYRVLSEIETFFPKWKQHKKLCAQSAFIYWVECKKDRERLQKIVATEILSDPISSVNFTASQIPSEKRHDYQWWCLEKTFRPGVTDNAGHVLSEAIALAASNDPDFQQLKCRSGSRLWLELPNSIDREEVEQYAREVFFNALIEQADVFSIAEVLATDSLLYSNPKWVHIGDQSSHDIEEIDVLSLSLDELEKLSNQRLWALSREELQAIQSHYQKLNRKMTDVEIEVLAQTWSEHCKHKIFAASINVKNERKDIELPTRIDSVFKTYIRGATKKIPAPYLRSVFEDNAGIISITDKIDCAIKVETHNSPSALDPYGGALTGIVGVNRDILGAGLGATPIANLDVFCVGPLDAKEPLPPRLHHPRRILEGVRQGVEDGGNKSGIPTVTGAVVHHAGFLGKPLIFCGTIGILPSEKDRDLIQKKILPGDQIVMAGGRLGKDGIHGATFSSLELNESSPVSAVQLGDPLTQKRVWDFLIEARDLGLFRAVTDNGAGGLSSSVGELAKLCGMRGGAQMDVGLAKTKYLGLKPFELTVSESQERMTFAVAPEKIAEFLSLAKRRNVECTVLGSFQDSGHFDVFYHEKKVASLDMKFLHEGLPTMQLQAVVQPPRPAKPWPRTDIHEYLLTTLRSANVSSRRNIVQQYDHEVQARTVRKPYGSPKHCAPNDGATLVLDRNTFEGIAVGVGLAPAVADDDPKVAAELAIDEALRNAVVAGMNPAHACLVDNFCWPDPLPSLHNPDATAKLGALVVTCKRIYEAAIELGIPFVSGKDSMKNDYRMGEFKISVPPTLLITTMGKVDDVRMVPVGYARGAGRRIAWVSGQPQSFQINGHPYVDFNHARNFYRAFYELVREGKIESAHDVSDGGWLVTLSEMLLGTGLSAKISVPSLMSEQDFFNEPATSFVVILKEQDFSVVAQKFKHFRFFELGHTFQSSQNTPASLDLSKDEKKRSWKISELEEAYGVLNRLKI